MQRTRKLQPIESSPPSLLPILGPMAYVPDAAMEVTEFDSWVTDVTAFGDHVLVSCKDGTHWIMNAETGERTPLDPGAIIRNPSGDTASVTMDGRLLCSVGGETTWALTSEPEWVAAVDLLPLRRTLH